MKEQKICVILSSASINAAVTTSLLKGLGFQVINTKKFDDATSFIFSGVADIALIDHEFTENDMNTEDIVAKIRNNIQGEVVPIVILTEHNEAIIETNAQISDTDGVLNKPISTDKVVTLFRHLSLI